MFDAKFGCGEGRSSVLDYYDLGDECCKPNDVVDWVSEDAAENVPLAVDLARVDFVEERHHDEGVEDDREVLRRGSAQVCISSAVNVEDPLAEEHDAEDDDELVDCLPEDVLGHGGGDEGRGSPVGFSEK